MSIAVDRRNALTLLTAGTVGTAVQARASAAIISSSVSQSVLLTPEQLTAQQQVLALFYDREVQALLMRLRSAVLMTPFAQSRDGTVALDRALPMWTKALILAELGKYCFPSSFLWTGDCASQQSCGHAFNARTPGDNPDAIYRTAYIDGGRNYVMEGWVDPSRAAANWIMEVGLFDPANASAIVPDVTLNILRRDQIASAPDGSFKITLGQDPQHGHDVSLRPGIISLKVREVITDRSTHHSVFKISEVDGGVGPASYGMTSVSLKSTILQKLPEYVHFWSRYPSLWMGGLRPNQYSHPMARHGGWGYIAGFRYVLQPDQAMLITISKEAAHYTAIQLTDPWMMQAWGGLNQTSLNTAQTVWGGDGAATYIISQQDLGLANWLNPAGVLDGFGIMRWHGAPAVGNGHGLIKEIKVVSLAGLLTMNLPKAPMLSV